MSSSCPHLANIRTPRDLWRYCTCLLTDPRYFLSLACFVVFGDAVLTQLIIRVIPCERQSLRHNVSSQSVVLDTEIDWETYMYQLELYLKGERDYALIAGPTGPLV